MDLSVVVVTHDHAAMIGDTLAAARRAAQRLRCQWIVVDSGSTDGTADVVERIRDVTVLRRENRGFAASVNAALPRCSAPYVLLLNPDAVIASGSLADAVAVLERDPRIGILGVPARRPDGTTMHTRGRRPRPARHWAEALGAGRFGWSRRLAETDDRPGRAHWIVGSLMLVRARAIAEVGPLDERYFLYREDTDWCDRFVRAGWRVVHRPTLDLVHDSPEHEDPWRAAQLAHAKLQYADAHFSRAGAWSTRCALTVHHAIRSLGRGRDAHRAALERVRGCGALRLRVPRR